MKTIIPRTSLITAATLSTLLLSGCGLFGGGKGGGGGGNSNPTTPPTATGNTTQQAFANGTAGYWQVDTIELNNKLEADDGVTEGFTTQRVNSTTVKYKDNTTGPVSYDAGDGALTPPSLTYGKSYLTSRLVDPNGNYQDESDPTAWKSGASAPKSGWLAAANDTLMAGQWYREFTVKSGPGTGKAFKVKANVVRGMAASSEGALGQLGYVDNKAKMTIALQNDVTADERGLLSRYFNLASPTENYLQESNNSARADNPVAPANPEQYVNPSKTAYRMLVNGKDAGADFALLTQSNGAILNTTDNGSGTTKLMPGLMANGGILVVKYPNRLLAVLYPAGYRVLEDTTSFKAADITNLGTGKLGNGQYVGSNNTTYDLYDGVNDFKYTPYAFVPNFHVGSFDNSYKYQDLGYNNGGDGYRNIVTYMDGNFTETDHAAWLKYSGVSDADISKWSALTSNVGMGWNAYRIRAALKAANKPDEGLNFTKLSNTDYYNSPANISGSKFAWIGASLPSGSDYGIELNRYFSGYDPYNVKLNTSTGGVTGTEQLGKVTPLSYYGKENHAEIFGISSWSFTTANQGNGQQAASNDKFSIDWANATLMSDSQAANQVNWNKLKKANASMNVGAISYEGTSSNHQATIKGSIQYLDHIAIYDSVPNVNRSDLGAVKISNLNDIYASPSLPTK